MLIKMSLYSAVRVRVTLCSKYHNLKVPYTQETSNIARFMYMGQTAALVIHISHTILQID